MTDDDLNRLIAEKVIGGTVRPYGTSVLWRRSDGSYADLPAYCTDPAAWGALLVWVANSNRGEPEIRYERTDMVEPWQALIYDRAKTYGASATAPGRALVLATLKAWGVEVEDD